MDYALFMLTDLQAETQAARARAWRRRGRETEEEEEEEEDEEEEVEEVEEEEEEVNDIEAEESNLTDALLAGDASREADSAAEEHRDHVAAVVHMMQAPVGTHGHCSPRRRQQTHLNPRLSQMATNDVANTVHESLGGGAHRGGERHHADAVLRRAVAVASGRALVPKTLIPNPQTLNPKLYP